MTRLFCILIGLFLGDRDHLIHLLGVCMHNIIHTYICTSLAVTLPHAAGWLATKIAISDVTYNQFRL